MSLQEVYTLLDSMKFGETVLVEYQSPSYILDFLLLLLKHYADERGLPLVIDDNLDILHVVNEHLKLFGVEGAFDGAMVVKTGGKINVGNVVGRIPLEGEPSLYLRRYEQLSREVLSGVKNAINAVIGLERLFAFTENRADFYSIISSIQTFVGNHGRKAFYFVDVDIAERVPFNPLPELERIATTVIVTRPQKDRGIGRIVKGTNVEALGKEIEVSLTELL
ncbi:DUF257 family protein [Palaeococcus ferrophilus]|uniref:DUF257 family protein n=1 Tax=Palaeococcus ferrophilus TaxID=83868 RepID=UPI00064FE4B8|nr:DUF257 family protein [Palaeococcus ferrophilus]